ncbi:MAG: flagellar hook assembly protein FlgD [Amphiplicatus sp.]
MEISALAASSQSASASSQLTANFDTFLKLLTTQLRNQDPLAPLDTEKFTEQLVQFSSVEQSIQTNSHLETLIAMQAAGERNSALSLVGRNLTLATDKAAHTSEGAAWTYTLLDAAASVSISVVDNLGRTVTTLEGATDKGAHAVAWNGDTDKGDAAAPGVYRLVVTARDADGEALAPLIETTARINAVSFAEGFAKLETAFGLVDLSAVTRVAADS